MLVLLPVLAVGLSVLACKRRMPCWREAIVVGAVIWGVVLVGITEVLSGFDSLNASGLTAEWLVALVAFGTFVLTGRSRHPRLAWSPPAIDWLSVALVSPLAVMVLLLGAIAISSPPNTWDSMTYHMARLIQWNQNASLAPYPTHNLRQLYMQPGAELLILQLQILSGGDHLAGLVQWASMVGGLIGTSIIARDLGARKAGMLCATIFAASLPIGILQATSTQNDYVVAFWLVCVVVCALRAMRASTPDAQWAWIGAFGASVGLAALTKATAYLVVLPVGLWVAIALVRRAGWRGPAMLAAAVLTALVINAGAYGRNLVIFGSPIGPLDEGSPSLRYLNEALSAPLLVSNVVRDVGINFVATPVLGVSVRAANLVRLIHDWLGVSISDPRSTWGAEVFTERAAGLAFDENFASNPVHVILILAALGGLWPLRRGLSPAIVAYALALVGASLLFALLVRWQPWHTRLELPFLLLGAPIVGTVSERISPRLAISLAALLLVGMLPWVGYNQARPLVGPHSILAESRDDQYFTNQPDLRAAYRGGIAVLAERGCARVGFTSPADGWEYPLWPLLTQAMPVPVEIQQVAVTNVSAEQANLKEKQFEPCAVFSLQPGASTQTIVLGDKTYRPVWAHEPVAILTVDGR